MIVKENLIQDEATGFGFRPCKEIAEPPEYLRNVKQLL